MTPTTLIPLYQPIDNPNTTSIISLLQNVSPNKKLSATGFKTVHIDPDRLFVCILEIAPLTNHIWKKSVAFNSLANVMHIYITTKTILELVSVVTKKLYIDVIPIYISYHRSSCLEV